MLQLSQLQQVVEAAKSLSTDLEIIIGKPFLRKFIAFLTLAVLVQIASLAIPSGPAASTVKFICDWASLFFFVCGLIYIAVGFLLSPYAASSTNNMPLEGLISGLIAGCIAAIVGGAAYYIPNVQGCPTREPIVKFMRLLPNSMLLGCVLGVFFGLYPPYTKERSVTLTSRRTSISRAPGNRPKPIDRGVLVADLLVYMGLFVIIVGLLVWLDNEATHILGEIAGNEQGNIVYWQYLCIIGTFALAYFVLTKWKLGWSGDARDHCGDPLCTVILKGVVVLLSSGLALGVIFGNKDIEHRVGRTKPDACSHAIWEDTSWPVVAFRIIVLFIWLYGGLYILYSRSAPQLDSLVSRACAWLRSHRT